MAANVGYHTVAHDEANGNDWSGEERKRKKRAEQKQMVPLPNPSPRNSTSVYKYEPTMPE